MNCIQFGGLKALPLYSCLLLLLACGGGSGSEEPAIEEPTVESPEPEAGATLFTGTFLADTLTNVSYRCLPSNSIAVTDSNGVWECLELDSTAQENRAVEFIVAGGNIHTAPMSEVMVALEDVFDLSAPDIEDVLLNFFVVVASISADPYSTPFSIDQSYIFAEENSIDWSSRNGITDLLSSVGVEVQDEQVARAALARHKFFRTKTNLHQVGFFTIHEGAQFVDVPERDNAGNITGQYKVYTHAAQASFLLPAIEDKRPAIFLSDKGLNPGLYLTTHDGRDGWANASAKLGVPSYVYFPENTNVAGLAREFASLERLRVDSSLWRQYGIGSELEMPYQNSKFSTSELATANFYANLSQQSIVEDAPSSKINLLSLVNHVAQKHQEPMLLIAQGSSIDLALEVIKGSFAIAGLILVEPAHCDPEPEILQVLNELPIRVILGKHLNDRNSGLRLQCEEMAASLFKDPNEVIIDLSGNGGSGLPMLDSNNEEVIYSALESLPESDLFKPSLIVHQATKRHRRMSSFYVGGSINNGEYVGASRVQSVIPEKVTAAPIILYPGLNFSASVFLSTIDGREGWASNFSKKGHPVFLFDPPDTSPSSVSSVLMNLGGWKISDVWNRFSSSIEFDESTNQGIPAEDTQYPFDNVTGFYPMMIGVGGRTGNAKENFSELLAYVYGNYGKAIVMGHSKGSEVAFNVAGENAASIRGLAALEPTQCDTYDTSGAKPANVTAAKDIGDFIAVYGDYIAERRQVGRFVSCTETVLSVDQAGNKSRFVSIPGDDFSSANPPAELFPGNNLYQTGLSHEVPMKGNTHMYMSDLNSSDIAEMISDFFR